MTAFLQWLAALFARKPGPTVASRPAPRPVPAPAAPAPKPVLGPKPRPAGSSRVAKGAALAAFCATLIGGYEGLRTVVYRDPVGIPTYCYGETRNPEWGRTYTPAECTGLLGDRLVEFERDMNRCLTRHLPDPTFAAFLSFTYNVGGGAFCSSTLVKLANAGDLVGACNQLPRWNKASGVPLPGLTRRRAEERTLCLSGVGADG